MTMKDKTQGYIDWGMRKKIIMRLFESLILPRYPWIKKIGVVKKDGPGGVYINIVIGEATTSEIWAAKRDFEDVLYAASIDKDDNGNKISFDINWT